MKKLFIIILVFSFIATTNISCSIQNNDKKQNRYSLKTYKNNPETMIKLAKKRKNIGSEAYHNNKTRKGLKSSGIHVSGKKMLVRKKLSGKYTVKVIKK